MRALAVVMLLATTARAEPLMLLWDTDYGPQLLDRDVAAIAVSVDGVTARGANRRVLRVRVERSFRGKHARGDAVELAFEKDPAYRRPISP